MIDFICAVPVIANFFAACAPPLPLASGYVEGEYVLIAPVETAEVTALTTTRGERVSAGAVLATLERQDAVIMVAQARAAAARAKSQLADLKQGKRPEEIAVLEATLNSARTQAAEKERAFQRVSDLLKRGIASQSSYDEAETARDVALAAVAQAEANLAVARLPARPDQIAAAEAAVAEAEAALASAEWRLAKRSLTAPANGKVTDIIRNPGDIAGPQAPVISMLPDGAVKLRLYIPEPALAAVKPGVRLAVNCDGCGPGLTATITYVANDPEFTPPVIYSLESRQKLVWLVEAKPDDGAGLLQPGQIVDADLAEDGGTAKP